MANKEHLKILKQGVEVWNAWRREKPLIRPDLSGANLDATDLTGAYLVETNLSGTQLFQAILHSADLRETILRDAVLHGANLSLATLIRADLGEAGLLGADLLDADLSEADLTKTELVTATFVGTNLSNANLDRAGVGWNTFADVDLSTTKGLETVIHHGPSTIGIDTLYKSNGQIPEAFLRGAGVPDEFITQIPALIASVGPIQFQSCFISYSHRDEEFAKRLHSAMRAQNLRVWFAPEEMKGGKTLREQIYQAIQVHDRLLLVLSTQSMKSEWVMTEIRRAKKVEREENRRKLFPITLVDFETIKKWECFDADSGKDLAAEVREFYIPDFSNWKDHDSFEREFAKLLGALTTEK